MSTHEHEIFLRALRSAADSIEPRSDGLDQIRARLRHRPYPLPVAWVTAAWMRLTLWLPERAFSPWRLAYSAPRQVARTLRSVSERFRGVPEPASGTLRTISQWFLSELPEPVAENTRAGKPSVWSLVRPLAAFGVAVFIVAVGAYAAIRIPAVSSPSGNSQQQGSVPGGGPSGVGGEAGNSSSPFASSGTGGSTYPGRRPSSPCLPVIRPGPSASATPTTSPSRSVSPSPTGSGGPSSSTSPSPTPSGTATPTPSVSPPAASGADPTAGAGAGAAGATTDAVILAAKGAAPSVQTSKSPCDTPSPSKAKKNHKKQPTGWLPNVTLTPGLGRSVTPAQPARHQSSSSS